MVDMLGEILEGQQFTHPMKPITIEISHCFQLSLTVEVNFPTNSTMITYKTEEKTPKEEEKSCSWTAQKGPKT